MLSSMFKKTWTKIRRDKDYAEQEADIPAGLWRKCNNCGKPIYTEDVKENFYVCPKCGGYFRVHAYRRIEMLADEGSFAEWNEALAGSNPLAFPGYADKLRAAQEKSGLREAVVTGSCLIDGEKTAIAVMDSRFMMASMGYAVGEKLTRMIERATAEKLPVIIFTASGGARMQEGIVSLMQMAKTAAALKAHSEAGGFSVMVLTNPTTGGVTASFAMLGDVLLAEPKALIGFAGPRVIEQTIHEKLPEGFQKAEFLLEHGFVDRIVPRSEQRAELAALLKLHACAQAQKEKKNVETQAAQGGVDANACERDDCAAANAASEQKIEGAGETNAKVLSAWERVKLSRDAKRPTALDYIDTLFDGFMELHGDRRFGDDGAVIGGVAWLGARPVTVIGIQKGRSMQDNLKRNFGMPQPEGYRKALRLMKQAEKFGRPVFCFVDTAGAYPGKEAEERGQGQAIAENLYEMSSLRVPILSVLIGEGGSGGALALAVANEVWMFENAIYSVLSPEGFASILYKDASKAALAAERMKITAQDLKALGVVDRVFSEPDTYTVEALAAKKPALTKAMEAFLGRCDALTPEALCAARSARFRQF